MTTPDQPKTELAKYIDLQSYCLRVATSDDEIIISETLTLAKAVEKDMQVLEDRIHALEINRGGR